MSFFKLLKVIGISITLVIGFLLTINFWIIHTTVDRIHYDPNFTKGERIGLIPGTSKKTVKGHNNLYFDQRIDAATDLYKQGFLQKIIVSGDNRTQYYNEPRDMLNALIDNGVPEQVIISDPEGISTLASVVRSQKVYGSDKILIITQDFHCYRALFIADHYGIDAIAYAADEKGRLSSKLATREVLARIKAVYDLYFQSEEIGS